MALMRATRHKIFELVHKRVWYRIYIPFRLWYGIVGAECEVNLSLCLAMSQMA